jgi:hypothetical protein
LSILTCFTTLINALHYSYFFNTRIPNKVYVDSVKSARLATFPGKGESTVGVCVGGGAGAPCIVGACWCTGALVGGQVPRRPGASNQASAVPKGQAARSCTSLKKRCRSSNRAEDGGDPSTSCTGWPRGGADGGMKLPGPRSEGLAPACSNTLRVNARPGGGDSGGRRVVARGGGDGDDTNLPAGKRAEWPACSNARRASPSLCSRSSRLRCQRQQHTATTTTAMATTATTTPPTTAPPFTPGSCTGGAGTRTPVGAAGGGADTQKRSRRALVIPVRR